MFNKETEYALRGLVYIMLQNLKERRPGTSEVAREIEAPPSFTAKILQRLVRSGLLESIKGKGGGFYINKKNPPIEIVRLITVTGGHRSLSGCAFGLKSCDPAEPCPLHDKYSSIRDSINELLNQETVQSLAEKVYSKEFKSV